MSFTITLQPLGTCGEKRIKGQTHRRKQEMELNFWPQVDPYIVP